MGHQMEVGHDTQDKGHDEKNIEISTERKSLSGQCFCDNPS